MPPARTPPAPLTPTSPLRPLIPAPRPAPDPTASTPAEATAGAEATAAAQQPLTGQGSTDTLARLGLGRSHTVTLTVTETLAAAEVELRLDRADADADALAWSSLPGARVTRLQRGAAVIYRFAPPPGEDIAPGTYTFTVQDTRAATTDHRVVAGGWTASGFALRHPHAVAALGTFAPSPALSDTLVGSSPGH
ncbi:hypothetical protein GCM10010442_77760 [Kitasatospora kifunensis]